jgi:hypothetical protein
MINCFQCCLNFDIKFNLRRHTVVGHRIHSMLLTAEDTAMGLTDGYVEVGLTRPEDGAEDLSWELYQAALGNTRGRGLHSSTFQLNLSRFWHKVHPAYPPGDHMTPPTHPVNNPQMHPLSHR